MEPDEKAMKRFKEPDPVLHSQLRLAVVSLLMRVESAEFTFIRNIRSPQGCTEFHRVDHCEKQCNSVKTP